MKETGKVLIVDDNPDFVFATETFLRRNGFETIAARNGKEGLELAEQDRPDVIVLDVMMENLFSGLEICKRLRLNSELRHIPIIGVSGIGDELDVHLSRWGDNEYFPVDEYYEKPLDREKLLESIRLRIKRGVRKRH